MDRAYSVLEVKSVDADRRVITGIATTPTPDRIGDILEPLGVTYNNPLPLLLHHDPTQPVGTVIFDPPTAARDLVYRVAAADSGAGAGARSRRGSLAVTESRADSRHVDRLQAARGRPVYLKSGGRHFLKTLVAELSLVTIPANIEATVLTVKSAASGHSTPGVSGHSTKARTP